MSRHAGPGMVLRLKAWWHRTRTGHEEFVVRHRGKFLCCRSCPRHWGMG